MSKINLVNFYHSRNDFPAKYALGPMRVAGSIVSCGDTTVKLTAIPFASSISDTIIEKVLNGDTEVIGISTMNVYNEITKDFIKKIREANTSVKLILGGPGINDFQKRYGNEVTYISYISGEFESNVNGILSFLEGSSTNTGDSKCPSVTVLEPLFSEKFSNQVLFDDPVGDFIYFETSRGCVYSCGYCGHKSREDLGTIDISIVAKEIRNIYMHGIRQVFIIDPIIGGKRERGKVILREFLKYPDIQITFYLRPEFVDEEYLTLLEQLNISQIRIGIQTLNEKVPAWIRGNNLDRITKFLPELSKFSIPWIAELIVGLPGDNMEGLKNSIKYVVDNLVPMHIYGYHLTAINDTPLYNQVNASGEYGIKIHPSSQRVISSGTYSNIELNKMLMFSTAILSLYNHLRTHTKEGKIIYDTLIEQYESLKQSFSHDDFEVFKSCNYAGSEKIWSRLTHNNFKNE